MGQKLIGSYQSSDVCVTDIAFQNNYFVHYTLK